MKFKLCKKRNLSETLRIKNYSQLTIVYEKELSSSFATWSYTLDNLDLAIFDNFTNFTNLANPLPSIVLRISHCYPIIIHRYHMTNPLLSDRYF